jgi:hypothetical protein
MTEPVTVPQAAEDSLGRETELDERSRRPIKLTSPFSGMLWFVGWLFTIGFAQLVWWKALLALILWPYFLGVTLR